MTLLSDYPILFILGVIVFLYFTVFSIKFPIIPAAIYPFTFLIFTQTMFAIGGISPSKYLGAILIFVGLIYLLKEILSKAVKNYSHLGLFCLIMLFPVWILIRFLIAGSDINLAFTFLLNALTTFSIVMIVDSQRRKEIMEISLGVVFIILSLGMIAAHYFPSITLFSSLQQGDVSRALGLVNDPNYGGAFIAIGFAYFFSKAIFFYEVKRTGWFCLSILLITISLYALFLTVSRAAILSVVVCLLMTVFYGRVTLKNLSWILPCVAILFVFYRYFPDTIDAIISRLSIITIDRSNAIRFEFFRTGISVIRNNLFWGVGDFSGYHNAFIDVAVFGGIIGLGFFLLLTLVVFKMNVKILMISEGEFREMARFVVLGIIVFLFNGLFIGIETERIVWYLFGWGMINFILFRKAHQNEIMMVGNSFESENWTKDEHFAV